VDKLLELDLKIPDYTGLMSVCFIYVLAEMPGVARAGFVLFETTYIFGKIG
jgi:hypothetical protein